MRVFLAVNLNKKLQEELAQIQNELRSTVHGVRWVDPQLLHITLKFLGEWDEEQLLVLEDPLRKVGENTAPFTISLARLGAFPSLNNPRVFWIGVEKGASPLIKLATDIEQCLETLELFSQSGGIPKNTGKLFKPHITLARKRRRGKQGKTAPEVFKNAKKCKSMQLVKSFYLMQSTLYSTGPVYTPLKEFLFGS